MKAREIINHVVDIQFCNAIDGDDLADAILAALREAGCRVLESGEVDVETLKRCMQVAYQEPHYLGGGYPRRDEEGLLPPGSPYDRGRYDARRSIRALKGTDHD